MPSFGGLLIVVAVAFAAPFLLGFFPSVRLPSVVLEILAGIAIGPSVLGIVNVEPVVAIILSATSLGVLIPVLKDAGEISSTFGQLVVAAGTVADFGAVILLSIFFSGEGGVGSTLLLIGSLVVLAGVVFFAVKSAEHSTAIRSDLVRLQDTTAQIRIRGALVLLVGFAAIADQLGLETILGAFIAGAVLSLLDQDKAMTHPDFRGKLEAVGFGFFIPVFFVTSGVNYDLDALLSSPSNVLMVPIFLAALVIARGAPALMYRKVLDRRRVITAGLMQATSLPFIVAATAIGMDLELLGAAEGAALIGAGLISVIVFPLTGLSLLRGAEDPKAEAEGRAAQMFRNP